MFCMIKIEMFVTHKSLIVKFVYVFLDQVQQASLEDSAVTWMP